MSISLSGNNISSLLLGDGNAHEPQGQWDFYVQNLVIQSADGSNHPLFTGGSATGSLWNGCALSSWGFEVAPAKVGDYFGTNFYVADHLGSAQMEFSASGTPLSMSQFMPFGGEINPAVTSNRYKFTGKERDTESGLDYFGARYYGSNMGRFMSPDPAILMPQKMIDPQQWNMYSYTRNSPLNMVDRNGAWPFFIHNDMIDAAFRGVLSEHDISLIKHESYLMDFGRGQQDPAQANQHGMCVPGQSASACGAGVACFVNGAFARASSSSGDDSTAYFADAGHTVMDLGSPEHVDSEGNGITWTGSLFQAIPHIRGELSPAVDWGGAGQSIRNLIELYELLHPGTAEKQGGLSK